MPFSVLFVYALTIFGTLIGPLSPYTAFLAYVMFGILKPDKLWFGMVEPSNYSRCIAIGMIVGWMLRGFGNWNLGRTWATILALLGFLLWAHIGGLIAPNKFVAYEYLDVMTKIIIPCFMALTLIDSVAKLKQLAWVIVISVGYVAWHENEVYFTGNFLDRDNIIAHTMAMGVSLGFFLGLYSEHLWQKIIAYACAGVMVHGVLIHESRGAMLGVLVMGILTFVLMEKKPRHYWMFFLGLLAAILMAGHDVQERFATIFASQENRDDSAESRLMFWAGMWRGIQANPMFGVGPDHWHLVCERYGLPPHREGHNVWLQVAAEHGFPGIICLATFYLLTLKRLWPIARQKVKAADPWIGLLACTVFATICGYMTEAIFGSFRTLEVAYYVGILGAGTVLMQDRLRNAATAAPEYSPELPQELYGQALTAMPRPFV